MLCDAGFLDATKMHISQCVIIVRYQVFNVVIVMKKFICVIFFGKMPCKILRNVIMQTRYHISILGERYNNKNNENNIIGTIIQYSVTSKSR